MLARPERLNEGVMSRPVLLILMLLLSPVAGRAQANAPSDSSGIARFNGSLVAATRAMDNEAILRLWADDGISLLPGMAPIEGRKAIGAFMYRVTGTLAGAHMERFDFACHDVTVSGDWASEWCTEHQIVRFANGNPSFDGWGKILFVLHRSSDGSWRIRREMWNQATPESVGRE
jgi:ketosteroid isomerase-like protein